MSDETFGGDEQDALNVVPFNFREEQMPQLYEWWQRYDTKMFWRFHNLRDIIRELYLDLQLLPLHCTARMRLSEKGFQEIYTLVEPKDFHLVLMTITNYPLLLKMGQNRFKENLDPVLNRLTAYRKKARALGRYHLDMGLRAVIKMVMNLPTGAMVLMAPDPDQALIVVQIIWKAMDNQNAITFTVQDSKREVF